MDNLEIIKRKAMQIFSVEDLEEKIKSGKKLKIKFGADPSRPDLHIGHSVPLRVLKQFQDMGHEINLPLSMHELLYPLMQGYDSVALNADIEIGGTDQTFNLLAGRELQRDYGQEPQVVMTFPLLVGLDGKEKMSKSLDNYIGITDSPFDKFEKSMKIPDEVLKQYFDLATDLSTDEINEVMSGDIREAHFVFAKELLSMYNVDADFEEIKSRYLKIAEGGIPEDIKEFKISEKSINVCDLLVKIGFSNSKSEAKRMIQGKGVKINSKIVEDTNKIIDMQDEKVVRFGKNKFMKISRS